MKCGRSPIQPIMTSGDRGELNKKGWACERVCKQFRQYLMHSRTLTPPPIGIKGGRGMVVLDNPLGLESKKS